jgi:TonB family protein
MLIWSAAGHVTIGLALIWSPSSDARPLEPLPIFIEVVPQVEPPAAAKRAPRQVVEEIVIPKRPTAARKPPAKKREPVQNAEQIVAQLRAKLGPQIRRDTDPTAARRGRFDPEMAAYRKQIKAMLYANWAGARVFRSQGPLKAHFRVKVDAGGGVRSLELVRPSGDRHFDESAERAIWKVEPFPAPPRGAFTLTLTFDPREAT